MQKDKATFGHRVSVMVICWSEWGVGGIYVLKQKICLGHHYGAV